MKHLILTVSLLLVGSLKATIVSYDYSGTVTSLQGQAEPKFGGLVAGDAITGNFSFDTDAINQGNAIQGTYGALSLSLQLGALSYVTSSSSIHIGTNNGYYWWMTGKDAGYSMNFDLFDTISPYLQLDTLLRPPPDLASVDYHFGSMNFLNGNEGEQTHLSYNIDSVTVHTDSVPEASSTMALLFISFGALLIRKRVAIA